MIKNLVLSILFGLLSSTGFAIEINCPQGWNHTLAIYDNSHEPAIIPSLYLKISLPLIQKGELTGNRYMKFSNQYLRLENEQLIGNFISEDGKIEKDFVIGTFLEKVKSEKYFCMHLKPESHIQFSEYIHYQRASCPGTPEWACRKIPYHFLRSQANEGNSNFHLDSDTSISTQ